MSKFGWDLPPGVSVSDLPGNSKQDQEDEAMVDALYEALQPLHDHMPNSEAAERCEEDVVLKLARMMAEAYGGGYEQGMFDQHMAQEELRARAIDRGTP